MGIRITVHAMLKMMFAICMGGMFGISAFVWIVTREIVFRHKAGQFLKTVSGVPKDPFLGGLFIVFCILLFAVTYGLRRQYDSINLAYVTLLFDFLLGIACVVSLHYNYNGIFLWVIANTLLYLKKNRGMLVIMILGIAAYLFTTPDIAAFSRNRYEIGRYIETLSKSSQTWFFGIYNLLTILTIVVFILCCVMIIVGKEEIIEKNAQLNNRLREANEELQRANAELENFLEENARLAEIRERNRIAREIHDTLGHTLTGIAAGLDACIALSSEASPILKNQLNLLSEASRKGIQDIRLSVSSLRPDAPQRLYLKRALESLIENTKKMTHTDIEFCCLIEKLRYDEDEENAIYRIIQESLTNAIRHGKAKHIRVFMEDREGSIYLKVEDDGIGCANIEAGFGLRHIRERINLLHGQVNFTGEKGFIVEALIPIRWGEDYD